MMSLTTELSRSEADNTDKDHQAVFLADYASLLAGFGATCIRVERNTRRMAASFGLSCDVLIMPTHVYVAVWSTEATLRSTAVRKVDRRPISFNINAALSSLSWEVADRHTSLPEAEKRMAEIRSTAPTGRNEVLVLTSLANASFCRLFGGDIPSMLIVLLSTLAGYRLKQIMLEDGRDVRLTFLCASFFSAALSAGGHIFNIGSTPEIALGTSVLYLIPGVPYINAVSDMIDRHYLCAFSRFIDSLVLTACLSAGLCAGMFILGLKWF